MSRPYLRLVAAVFLLLHGAIPGGGSDDGQLTFSPPVEVMVPDDGSFFDFETGRIEPFPKVKSFKAAIDWATRNGFDTWGEGAADGLLGFDMVALQVDGPIADFFPEVDVNTARKRIKDLVMLGQQGTPVQLDARAGVGPAATYLFQTREGRGGILQITGWNEQTKAVAVRYRLLGSEPAEAATPEEHGQQEAEAESPRFGSVNETFLYSLGASREGSSALDLETGNMFLNGAEQEANIAAGVNAVAYVRHHGVDLWAKQSETEALKAFGMSVVRVPKEMWEDESRALHDLALLRPTRDYPYLDLHVARYGKGPAAYLFKTSEGSLGMLQILQFDPDKRGTHIRYKLLVRE